MADLSKLRQQIDVVDNDIYQLIKQRAILAHKVGDIKKQNNNMRFYKAEREAQVLQNIISINDSLLRDKDIAYIFRQIMSACLALEQPLNVAYLGPEGTWTFDAALKHFGNGINTNDCHSIDEVFLQVAKKNADYGVVPIENSSNGTVTATVNLLYKHNLKICGEVEVLIKHQLLAQNNENITTIAAHQQALEQCRKYLQQHYPNAKLKSVNSNAVAAQIAAKDDTTAAIASHYASEVYKLKIIGKNIEDSVNNTTRFLIIGNIENAISNNDKTTILLIAEHKIGVLSDLLASFKKHNVNILKLDSYPNPNNHKWQYLFLLDVEGHIKNIAVKKAIASIQNNALEVKILGSYPQAIL